MNRGSYPDYGHIERIYATGTGNIAETILPTVFTDRAWYLVYVRCHFAGAAGTATISISVDSLQGSAYDTVLTSTASIGTGADYNLRVQPDDQRSYQFPQSEPVTVNWTNPDSGNITWGLEVGIAPASKL